MHGGWARDRRRGVEIEAEMAEEWSRVVAGYDAYILLGDRAMLGMYK